MRYINFEEAENQVISDEFFMREALKEAQRALELEEVPIGAVIVHGGRIIARGHNLTQRLNDVTAHAEMQAFTAAANYIGGKYLKDCTLYVTVEPCVMCAGAAYWTQVRRIVYGAADPKRGYSNFGAQLLHPKSEVTGGVLAEECGDLVTSFFRKKR
jgi:tRNA(adenine34) deaminase